MNTNYRRLMMVVALIAGFVFQNLAFADDASTSNDSTDKNWEFSQSIKYSIGKYGTSQESETYEEDTMLQRDFDNSDVSITIPSLWQTGDVTATNSGREVIKKKVVKTTSNSTITPTVSGLGDIAFNGNYYLLDEDDNAPLDVTLTGYLKAPTASSRLGLGTGELDGGPGVGFTKKLVDNLKAIMDASYTFDGKVSGAGTRNQTNLDLGIEYNPNAKISSTVKYEYSSSAAQGTSDAQDIALLLDYKINDDWKINGEVTWGLSTASPDESYLLGATLKFDGNLLGGLFSAKGQAASFSDYESATSPFALVNDRIISDPLYLPLKSQLYGATSYTFNMSHVSDYTHAGVKTNSNTYANTFAQTMEYGLTDHLAVRLTDSYEFEKAYKALTTTGSNTTSDNEGFNNPTIATTYRLIDQTDSSYDLDLGFSIAPDSFKDKEAGNGHDGTVASGNQPLTLSTSIGREMKAFTIQGTFSGVYEGNKYYEALSNDDNYYVHEFFNYVFGLNTQTRITERLSFNLGAGYTLADRAYSTNLTTGTKSTVNQANTLDFNAAINYHFIPNKLVGSITYTYDDYSKGSTTYATATSDTSSNNHYANIIGARMQYLF